MYTENTVAKLSDYMYSWRNIEDVPDAIYCYFNKIGYCSVRCHALLDLENEKVNMEMAYIDEKYINCPVDIKYKYYKAVFTADSENTQFSECYINCIAFDSKPGKIIEDNILLFNEVSKIEYMNYTDTVFDTTNIVTDNTYYIVSPLKYISEILGSINDNIKNITLEIRHFCGNSITQLFKESNLKDITFKMNFNEVIDANQLFKDCVNLKKVSGLRLDNVKNCKELFSGCSSLKSLDSFDGSKITNTLNMFKDCYSLELFDGLRNLSCDLDLSDCSKLNRSSIASILVNLALVPTKKTIKLNEFIYALLYDIDKQYIAAKNWKIESKELNGITINNNNFFNADENITDDLYVQLEFIPYSVCFKQEWTYNLFYQINVKASTLNFDNNIIYLGENFNGVFYKMKLIKNNEIIKCLQPKLFNCKVMMYESVNDRYYEIANWETTPVYVSASN